LAWETGLPAKRDWRKNAISVDVESSLVLEKAIRQASQGAPLLPVLAPGELAAPVSYALTFAQTAGKFCEHNLGMGWCCWSR
jgi:hypothetical protein